MQRSEGSLINFQDAKWRKQCTQWLQQCKWKEQVSEKPKSEYCEIIKNKQSWNTKRLEHSAPTPLQEWKVSKCCMWHFQIFFHVLMLCWFFFFFLLSLKKYMECFSRRGGILGKLWWWKTSQKINQNVFLKNCAVNVFLCVILYFIVGLIIIASIYLSFTQLYLYTNLFDSHHNPVRFYYYHPHFVDQETEFWRDLVI